MKCIKKLTRRLHVDLKHEVLSNFRRANLVAGARHDAHGAGGWRASVGDSTRRRQHRYVKRERHVLFAGLIDTFDVERLSVRRH